MPWMSWFFCISLCLVSLSPFLAVSFSLLYLPVCIAGNPVLVYISGVSCENFRGWRSLLCLSIERSTGLTKYYQFTEYPVIYYIYGALTLVLHSIYRLLQGCQTRLPYLTSEWRREVVGHLLPSELLSNPSKDRA